MLLFILRVVVRVICAVSTRAKLAPLGLYHSYTVKHPHYHYSVQNPQGEYVACALRYGEGLKMGKMYTVFQFIDGKCDPSEKPRSCPRCDNQIWR